MSEKQEHRRRHWARYEYLCRLEAWLNEQPPLWRIVRRVKWKKARPVYED